MGGSPATLSLAPSAPLSGLRKADRKGAISGFLAACRPRPTQDRAASAGAAAFSQPPIGAASRTPASPKAPAPAAAQSTPVSKLARLRMPTLALGAAFAAATLSVVATAMFTGSGRAADLESAEGPRNVLGSELGVCSTDPMTGFMRNGRCETGPTDFGTHTVCARVSDAFLQYTLQQGNDLITPRPEFRFPGLKEGDGWCLCASRWREALRAGVAPPVVLGATHEKTLQYVGLDTLQQHEAQ